MRTAETRSQEISVGSATLQRGRVGRKAAAGMSTSMSGPWRGSSGAAATGVHVWGGPTGASESVVPALVLVSGTGWGFFVHANVAWRFGPLEALVATPAFHHWHHTLTGPINRNYSSMLPWLDRVFGTFHLPRDRWPSSYGIAPSVAPAIMPEPTVGPIPDAAGATASLQRR